MSRVNKISKGEQILEILLADKILRKIEQDNIIYLQSVISEEELENYYEKNIDSFNILVEYQKIHKSKFMSEDTLRYVTTHSIFKDSNKVTFDTKGEILNIIISAKKTLLIYVAFADKYVLEELKGYLKRKIEEGVEIRILTRNDNAEIFYSKLNFIPKKFIKVYEKGNPFATHAKVLLADKKWSYVGSANMTKYSFETNLELGVSIKNDEMNFRLYDLLDFIWKQL